jgi:CMP-N,N'-diacetyllegionaminic acid synthase
MKIAALLTGKENSSFRYKNLKKIKNIPIFLYPCIEAKKVKEINKFFVSSDSKKILNECSKMGFFQIKRPKYLSKKNTLHLNVLKHSLLVMKKNNYFPDILLVLLANAPIIKSSWIKDCINILNKNNKITAVVPVVENNDNHPLRAKRIHKGFLSEFINNKKNTSSNRQDLEKCYFLCHNFWLIKVKSILENRGNNPWKFMGKQVRPYIVQRSIDIHNAIDLEIAKILIKNDKFLKKNS